MATDKAQEPGGKGLFTKANLKAFLLVNLGVLLLTVGVYFFKLPTTSPPAASAAWQSSSAA